MTTKRYKIIAVVLWAIACSCASWAGVDAAMRSKRMPPENLGSLPSVSMVVSMVVSYAAAMFTLWMPIEK